MKTEFSRSWVSSSLPGKQRKFLANAPLHIRHKLMSAHLTKELRLKYKKRAFPVRKGDKVKVMEGKFRGVIGEIERIDMKKYKVFVKGAELKKKEGAPSIHYPIHPSKLQIITLNVDDKRRIKALERR
ncbi:MAG TPA: 50S ribosomal protein L24 [Candidatus Nanoarchaeia archaeon]|nr:50S ribosomal protein L24 [Candidatus Nanoarchaeia archaeon]